MPSSFAFKKAEEGINIAIHWQDADSSAMTEQFPDVEIMICTWWACWDGSQKATGKAS